MSQARNVKGLWAAIGANLLLGAWFYALLDTHFLPSIGGSLNSFGSTWGDLPWHLSIIMGFVERGWGALLQDPVYAGAKLVYPFLPEVFPGLLVKAGLSLRSALIITTGPFLILLTSLLTLLSYRITRSAYAAAISPLLFCLGGSVVGTWYFLQDTTASGQGILSAFWSVSQSYANIFKENLYFTNVVSDFLLPQRTIVFGLVLGLCALLFLWSYWSQGKQKALLLAAVCIGLLPLFHTHSFIALCIISATLGVVDLTQNFVRKTAHSSQLSALKLWTFHFGLLAILALPQLLLVLPKNSGSFLHWQVGWLAKDGSWLGFWLKNLGAYFFLIPLAWIAVLWKESSQPTAPSPQLPASRPYPVFTFYLGFLTVFVVANLLIFQPWDWDNMKLLLWWFLGSIIIVLHALVHVIRSLKKTKPYIRITVYCLLITVYCSLVSTGLLAARYETSKSLTLFNPADRELAAFVRQNTPPDAIFLTSERHNHPVPTLAGRQIFMGYGGWLWTHGIDASSRGQQVKTMLSGGPEAISLLTENAINYVVLERNMPETNREFFENQGKRIFENAEFMLYEVQ